VLDIRHTASLGVMGSRTVSPDAKATAAYARQFLRGLKDAGVAGCGKHFPGLGEANLDSHELLPRRPQELQGPLERGLAALPHALRQLPLVMVAHCAFPEVTGDPLPASISRKWITDIPAQENRLPRSGGLRRSRDGRSAQRGHHRGGRRRHHSRRAPTSTGLPQRRPRPSRPRGRPKEAERSSRFRAKVETAAQRILRAKQRWPAVTKRMAAAPTDAAVNRLRQQLWEFSEQVRLTANALQAAPSAQPETQPETPDVT